jgi:hypothetical protein
MAFSFLVNLIIAGLVPSGARGYYTGGLVTLYCFLFAGGALSMTRFLAFGLMLGVSRRVYYLGTTLMVLALAVVYGLGLTALQAIERATGGWGLNVNFFRVPWILGGPWYQTWLTSFVLLVLFSCTACGMGWCTGAGACPAWLGSSPPSYWWAHWWWSCWWRPTLARVRTLLQHHADAAGPGGRAGGGGGTARAGRVHHHAPGHDLTARLPIRRLSVIIGPPSRRQNVISGLPGQLSKLSPRETHRWGAADGDSR